MRISLGFAAARARRSGTKPAAAPISKPRRESMTTSGIGIGPAHQRRATADVEAGNLSPPSARRRGRPRALAAFIQRPQAARSNRRYFYSLEELLVAVN